MDPLAYLLTWTTYGSWLPGDARGWVRAGTPGIQAPDTNRQAEASQCMTEHVITLDQSQRQLVEATIREHCRIRAWFLHAVNVRSNHVHVVLTAPVKPEEVLRQLKTWCSRRLSEATNQESQASVLDKNGKQRWWTEHGSTKWINDEDYLQNAIRYVNERQ